jgi:hypothetical protein
MTRAWRRRILGALIAMFWATAGASALACPVCFRVEEGPVTDGVRAAVLVLVGVTVGVLSGFGVFIVRFVRRAAVEDLP